MSDIGTNVPGDRGAGTSRGDPQPRTADAGSRSGMSQGTGTTEGIKEGIADRAEGMADDMRDRASEHLSTLAGSVRRASDDYRKAEPGLLADLMGHAADSVDALARNIGGQSTSDMIGSARDFGRRNPVGLLLGGVAAGFAISRLAAAATRSSAASAPSGTAAPARSGTQAGGPVHSSEGDFRHGA